MTLIKHLLNRGHLLGLDNFYTDIVLFMHLRDNRTDAVGTIRAKRRALPVKVVGKKWKDDQKSKIRIRYNDDFYCFNWMDRKNVKFLATCGSPDMVEYPNPR
jgi:hypothetical protein